MVACEAMYGRIALKEIVFMHRSRLASIVIDCDNLDAGVAFWSGALGATPQWPDDPNDPYVSLGAVAGGLRVLLQQVGEGKTAKSRVHLDIETDDVAAEVARLERLGAQRHQEFPTYWVLLDPCGNEFCVVPPESEGFPERTVAWER